MDILDDWTTHHQLAAARQGWCISDTGERGHGRYEIQRIDDVDAAGGACGVAIPQFVSDIEAVAAMRDAYTKGEDHGLLAYRIIKLMSQSEFEYWKMGTWGRTGNTA